MTAAQGDAQELIAKPAEGGARDAVPGAEVGEGHPVVEQPDDLAAVVDQSSELGAAALAASERDTLLASERQRLAGAHGDEVAFDFGHQSEGEAENLAVDGVVEGVPVLGAVEMHLLFEQPADERHDVCQRAAQAGEFGDDERVAAAEAFDECAQLAFASLRAAAGDLGDPAVDAQAAARGEALDLVSLIGQRLPLGADPQIGYNHNADSLGPKVRLSA